MTEKNLVAEIGAKLLKRREALGYTREKLAVTANIAASTLARIELGTEPHPRAPTVGAILMALRAGKRPTAEEQEFEAGVLLKLAGL